jgi:phage tail protein X
VLPDGDGFRAVTHIPLSIVERIVRLDPGLADASPLG